MEKFNIVYPTDLSKIPDQNNDNIDVIVEMNEGASFTVVVTTPKNLIWQMNNEGVQYIPPACPFIIVKSLTHEIISDVLRLYVENNAYWLKLIHVANHFKVQELESVIQRMNSADP